MFYVLQSFFSMLLHCFFDSRLGIARFVRLPSRMTMASGARRSWSVGTWRSWKGPQIESKWPIMWPHTMPVGLGLGHPPQEWFENANFEVQYYDLPNKLSIKRPYGRWTVICLGSYIFGISPCAEHRVHEGLWQQQSRRVPECAESIPEWNRRVKWQIHMPSVHMWFLHPISLSLSLYMQIARFPIFFRNRQLFLCCSLPGYTFPKDAINYLFLQDFSHQFYLTTG